MMKSKRLLFPVTAAWLTLFFLWSGTGSANAVATRVYELSATIQGNNVRVEWIGQSATLEASANLLTWNPVVASSPYVIGIAAAPKFFRLRLPPIGTKPSLVRGYIATRISGLRMPGGNTNAHHDIALPCVEVYLRNETSGVPGISDLTDLAGRFTLPTQPGRYRICWKGDGFPSGCSDRIYTVSTQHLHVSTVLIRPMTGSNTTVVYGNVRMKDGTAARRLEPLVPVNAFARVELLDANGQLIQEVFANESSEYLQPKVPVGQAITLRAKIEGAQKDRLILPEADLGSSPVHAVNLDVGNSRPHLGQLFATDGTGARRKTGQPGQIVQLRAAGSDPDGDTVKYKWVLGTGSGSLSATDIQQVNWTLPTVPGRYSASVLAYDGKGGYAKSTLSMRVDNLGIPFSGTVNGTDGLPVAGAQVTVNGLLTATSAAGKFRVRVPNANRFVLNLRKAGYGLVSQIYDNSVTGGRWTMALATVVARNPTQPIDVVDQRDGRNCAGPLSCQLDWRGYPQLAQPQYQDGSNRVVAPFGGTNLPLPGLVNCPSNRPCGPGIRIQIPANALQDQFGMPPTGNVDVQLSTIDLESPGQMPGDYTVLQPDQSTRVMQSYGAGLVEITAGSRRYNLKPGMQATLTIPADPAQVATGAPLPPVIPILFYNETQGVWMEEGTATLAGTVYLATVNHFSAINCDLVKVNQACVRIQSPTSSPQNMPASYNLEILIPQSGGAAPVRLTKLIDNSVQTTHVLYNLPANTPIVLVPIRIANNIPLGTFVVNTGGPQNPASPNLPVFPYAACSTEVTLSDLAYPPANSGEFLDGLYSFEANNLSTLLASTPADVMLADQVIQATANYYARIDPCGERLTLQGFKNVNKFGQGLLSEVNVKFANFVDLGFGRDMTGVRDGQDTAAFVTNYGDNTTPDADDVDDAVQGPSSGTEGLTVAMEYSPIKGSGCGETDDTDPVVKFYVYKQDGTRTDRANLDGLGDRPVPQLCMVCHGGAYPSGGVFGSAPPFDFRADAKLNAKYLPFDLHSYVFSSTPPYDKASQQLNFKKFNDTIVKVSPPGLATDPIPDIITQMYGGISQVDPNVQDEVFVVGGWNTSADRQGMYRDVIGRSCRICHAAHSFPALNFHTSQGYVDLMGGAEQRVCVSGEMPHSKVTHNLFWTSVGPHQPGVFQVFGDTHKNDPTVTTSATGWQGNLCGIYTAPGSTPMTPFQLMVEPIFNTVRTGTSGNTTACTTCHLGGTGGLTGGDTGGAGSSGLTLTTGNAWGELVNILSQGDATKDRVEPGSDALSRLWLKISGASAGSQMPLGASKLSPADRTIIQNWILGGAPQ